ncbi:MAG: O-antigen ligase family protein [Anaerolineales bacterium]
MASYVVSRGFVLVTLVWAVAGAVLITFLPGLGGLIALLTFIPFALRLLAGRSPFSQTPFGFFFIVFILTAGLGVWAAYNPAAAWAKFWILVSAGLIFYALALQTRENFWPIVAGLCGLAAALSIFFLLGVDWSRQPSDFGFIQRLGEAWSRVRPAFEWPLINKNIFGGSLAMLLPFNAALALRGWRTRDGRTMTWAAATALIALVGLLLTGERAAWVALAAGLGTWFLWSLCRRFAHRLRHPPRTLFLALVGLAVAGVVGLLTVYPGGPVGLLNRFSGPSDFSRVTLFQQSANLIRDFALTGAGLNAFSGLYARYEMAIPYFIFDYSHNFFLDVAIEQGVFGALALGVIFAGSFGRGLQQAILRVEADPHVELLLWAVIAAFVTVLAHGFLDDALYGDAGTPWLFLLPGLAVMLTRDAGSKAIWARLQLGGAGLMAVFLVGGALLPGGRAAVYANLGAVEMARYELAGWPEVSWQDRGGAAQLTGARSYFEQALVLDPQNVTAAYRLGLMEVDRDNLVAAIDYLQPAQARQPAHRGLAKTLGYSYTWLGHVDEAATLLRSVPEAQYELDLYAQWWPTVGYTERGLYATQMARRLEELGLPYTGNPLAKIP